VTALIAVGSIAPASASELRIGDQTQSPNVLYSQTVFHRPHGGCELGIVDGAWGFPTPLTVPAGAQRATVVFRREARPERVDVTASYAVDPFGKPSGPRDSLEAQLKPVREPGGGAAGWRLTFAVEPPQAYYLVVSAHWPRDRRCGIATQSRVTYSVIAG
jgi:hypothetical protein